MAGKQTEINKLLKELRRPEYGCTIVGGGNGRHWRVSREGSPIVFISRTPQDPRALDNIKADLRRLLNISL